MPQDQWFGMLYCSDTIYLRYFNQLIKNKRKRGTDLAAPLFACFLFSRLSSLAPQLTRAPQSPRYTTTHSHQNTRLSFLAGAAGVSPSV